MGGGVFLANYLHNRIINSYSSSYDETKITNIYLIIIFALGNGVWNFFYGMFYFYLGIVDMGVVCLISSICFLSGGYLAIFKKNINMCQHIFVFSICFYVIASAFFIGFDKDAHILLMPLLFASNVLSASKERTLWHWTILMVLTYIFALYIKFNFTPVHDNSLYYIKSINFIIASVALLFIIYCKRISVNFLKVYNKSKIENLEKQINTDFLTGLHSRKYMEEFFIDEAFFRYSYVILADIDYFKNINDTYGHVAGDYVLKELANFIALHFRGSDLVSRWGGEEFLIYIRNAKNIKLDVKLEELRNKIVDKVFLYEDKEIKLTMTFGVKYIRTSFDIYENIRYADEALYYGKNNGRNQVVFHREADDEVDDVEVRL